jgi:DUF438 domain-containing protein
MKNTVIYLIGFPGTGKYTIAQQLSAMSGAKLIDNHLINNPIFSVIEQDGIVYASEALWEKIREIRQIVFDTVKDFVPKSFSLILTNHLADGDEDDVEIYHQIESLALARGNHLVPVRLFCEPEELYRRIAMPQRAERYKITDADYARRHFHQEQPLNISHPNLLDLDVTHLPPADAAQAILHHVARRGIPPDTA